METRLLRMFAAVARHGGLVGAAKEVHLTPSALSHALKGLERDLGCRLFERSGKRLVLNQAGEHLLAGVQGPLAAIEAAAAEVRRLNQWGASRLRIGAAVSTCQHLIPRVIRELRKQYPKLQLQIESGDTQDMLRLLRDHRIDLALGVAPETGADLTVRSIFRDELLFVFASTHPWADGRPLSRDELRQQPLILYQRSSLTARLVQDYFRRLNIAPCSIMEVASITAIKELVQLNLGVSVLAPWVADGELARGDLRMRPLGAQALRRRWVVLHLASRRLNLLEETFCRLCRAQAASMRLDRSDLPDIRG